MKGGRQIEASKEILSAKNVPYMVAAPLLIQGPSHHAMPYRRAILPPSLPPFYTPFLLPSLLLLSPAPSYSYIRCPPLISPFFHSLHSLPSLPSLSLPFPSPQSLTPPRHCKLDGIWGPGSPDCSALLPPRAGRSYRNHGPRWVFHLIYLFTI